jgi:PilZ domain
MQKFDYRAARVAVDFPVRLEMHNSLHFGRCRDISEDGMRLELLAPFAPQCCGEVSFSYHELNLELRVRVTHAGATYDGLKFIFQSGEQRTRVRHLMSILSKIPQLPTTLFLISREHRPSST